MKDEKMTLDLFKNTPLFQLNRAESITVKGGNPKAIDLASLGPRIFCENPIRKDFTCWRAPGQSVFREVTDKVSRGPWKIMEFDWRFWI